MSETENSTEKNTETKTVDTAPYMKKPGANQTESTASNLLIPAALVLISAVVINVSFYGDKNKAPLTQTEKPVIETIDSEIVAAAKNVEAGKTAESAAAKTAPTTEESNVQTDATETNTTVTSEQSIIAKTETAPIVSEAPVIKEEKVSTEATPQTPAVTHMAATRPTPAPYRYTPYAHQQMPARTKQHMEMLQQRRQAYEREMQNRRAQYEAAMKARQEKRAKVAEAKKAVFQQARKERLAAEQRVQALYEQIAKLQEEIHQIMQKSRNQGRPVRMHSM